jgi:hypothetical protein
MTTKDNPVPNRRARKQNARHNQHVTNLVNRCVRVANDPALTITQAIIAGARILLASKQITRQEHIYIDDAVRTIRAHAHADEQKVQRADQA